MALSTFMQTVIGSASGTTLTLLLNYLLNRSLQKKQTEAANTFAMGSNSHMATVMYDKFIEFCEKYIKAVSETVQNSAQQSSGRNSAKTEDLLKIRQECALWLTDELEAKLDDFERRIAIVGISAPFFDPSGDTESNEQNIKKEVIPVLRKLLLTEELTALRTRLLNPF